MEIERIAIIGAGGEMGRWFAKFFASEGVEVFASDKFKEVLSKLKKEAKINLAKNNKAAVKSADFILISVLLKNFEAVIKEIAPAIGKNQIVIDITSLKEKPVRIMHQFLKGKSVLGAHPLFGPEVKDTKQNFFLTPTNGREKLIAKEFGGWLKKRGFSVITATPQEHDRLMAVILGIPHFVGLAAGSLFSKFNIRELEKTAGPSFKKLLELVQSVAFSSPELYSELHLNLSKINELEDIYEKEVKSWREIIKKKNASKFMEKMLEIKNQLI